ncbi:Imm21 family immunity protein [Streptomyces sp. NPDC001698]|uniref:Imm21 family immunity protein n=1 Tax=unclassified Streptomyces TaxID=2593676 RepID=UPI0036CD773E
MGGPLIVIPVSALAAWRGCTQTGAVVGDSTAPDDYDRACAVTELAGAIRIGDSGAQALVLADEPATSCYLPEYRTFLRWLAAGSETGLKAAAEAVLADPATEWEECGTWRSDGPAVLMDSVEAGADLSVVYPGGGMPSQAPVRCPPAVGRSVPSTPRRMRRTGWAWSNSSPWTPERAAAPNEAVTCRARGRANRRVRAARWGQRARRPGRHPP